MEMTNFENYKKLAALLGKAKAEIPRIEGEIATRLGDQSALNSAAVKARAIEAEDAQELADLADENKNAIEMLRSEQAEAKTRIAILESEADKLRGAAVNEIKAYFCPRFEVEVRKAAQKLSEAAEAEERVLAIRREAGAMGSEISLLPLSMTPPVLPLLAAKDGGMKEDAPLARWLRAVAAEGIELE